MEGASVAYKARSTDNGQESRAARIQEVFHNVHCLFPCQKSGLPFLSSSASSSCCVVAESTTGELQLRAIQQQTETTHKLQTMRREESCGCSPRAMVDAHHSKV